MLNWALEKLGANSAYMSLSKSLAAVSVTQRDHGESDQQVRFLALSSAGSASARWRNLGRPRIFSKWPREVREGTKSMCRARQAASSRRISSEVRGVVSSYISGNLRNSKLFST